MKSSPVLVQLQGKDVIFVGAGKGRNMAGVRTFLEQHGNIKSFTGVDKQSGVAPLDFLRQYDSSSTIFIKNESIPGTDMPVPYITSMQLFFELASDLGIRTVGITGTKGKSTTSALTAHILKTAGKPVVLAGNIGVSPLPALGEATDATIFVLELSSYQLADLRRSPNVSACTNLYNDHTDWHGSLEAYWEAKHNIMRYTGPDDLFVYNPTFPVLVEWAATATCRTHAIDTEATLDLSNTQLFGEHNRLNALIAREVVREFGITDEQFRRGLESFAPLEHRTQVVATKHGITYIDDAIGMTPESTMASLKAISEKYERIGCLLLGGQDRNYDFGELMQRIASYAVPMLVLFPDTIQKMRAALPLGYHPDIFETTDMAEAVRLAAAHAPKDSAVVLSTAAPSYSLWKDFEDKGDQFQAAVGLL